MTEPPPHPDIFLRPLKSEDLAQVAGLKQMGKPDAHWSEDSLDFYINEAAHQWAYRTGRAETPDPGAFALVERKSPHHEILRAFAVVDQDDKSLDIIQMGLPNDTAHAKQAVQKLLRFLSIKYPTHPLRITVPESDNASLQVLKDIGLKSRAIPGNAEVKSEDAVLFEHIPELTERLVFKKGGKINKTDNLHVCLRKLKDLTAMEWGIYHYQGEKLVEDTSSEEFLDKLDIRMEAPYFFSTVSTVKDAEHLACFALHDLIGSPVDPINLHVVPDGADGRVAIPINGRSIMRILRQRAAIDQLKGFFVPTGIESYIQTEDTHQNKLFGEQASHPTHSRKSPDR